MLNALSSNTTPSSIISILLTITKAKIKAFAIIIKRVNKDNLAFKNSDVLYFPKTAYAEINRRWKNPFR